jgi:hypothetical protein
MALADAAWPVIAIAARSNLAHACSRLSARVHVRVRATFMPRFLRGSRHKLVTGAIMR